VSDFDDFKSYYSLSAKLVETLSTEQLADCLRMLAPHVADYRARFGVIPQQDVLRLLGATELDDDQVRLLRDGMEVLVGYLALARDADEGSGSPSE
jgi:hypothetical protein